MPDTHLRLREHAKWASIGTLSLVMIQLLTLALLARILSPAEFGVVATCTLIIQFVYIFSEFGIGTLVIQRRDIHADFLSAAHQMSCLIALLVTGILVLAAPALALWFATPELANVLQLYSIFLLMQGAMATQVALHQRELRYRKLALVDIFSYLMGYAGVSLLLAWLSWSYWSLVVGYIVQVGIKYLLLPKQFKIESTRGAISAHAHEFLRFGCGQSLSRLGSYLAGQVDSFIVASKMGMTATGIYSRAHQLATMPANQLGSIFDKVIFPFLSRLQEDSKNSQKIYFDNLTAVTTLGVLASTCMWVTGDFIVWVILGENWASVTDPLKVLSLAIPLRMVQHICDPTARAYGSTYRRAWRQWIFAGITCTLTLWLYPYGLTAVAWGIIGAAAVNAILMIGLCAKILDCRMRSLILCLLPACGLGLFTAGLIALSYSVSMTSISRILLVAICCVIPLLLAILLAKKRRTREYLL